MSCTVVALPFALAQFMTIAMGLSVTSVAAMGANGLVKEKGDKIVEKYADTLGESFSNGTQHIKVSDVIEKEFETAYIDKNILLKTLEEHGVINIEEEYEGKISGEIENFTLTFTKPSENKPYNLKITCRDCDNAEEKLNNLNSEYALNVQEEAYLKLINRLKENNMQIENEVVEDDNTIVLTINLE